MLYFAYGSNICTGRLRGRVPSAKPVQVATLSGYTFHFHKRSDDGSGKGNAFNTRNPADAVVGVLFNIDAEEKGALDNVEGVGHGYIEIAAPVTDKSGNEYEAFMYVADAQSIDDTLQPYSWYKRFVVDGARQHNLPEEYVGKIENMPSTEDPNTRRDARNRAIKC